LGDVFLPRKDAEKRGKMQGWLEGFERRKDTGNTEEFGRWLEGFLTTKDTKGFAVGVNRGEQ
jgi:hypothetical protein